MAASDTGRQDPGAGGSAELVGAALRSPRPRLGRHREGPGGWGTSVYAHVLARAGIGPGTRVLDCGCGAGRFVGLAAERGAAVAGLDVAAPLIEIATERTPAADLRVGDLEHLPWPEDAFDVVTGFSAFQFAADKLHALAEARRVSGRLVVVIPTRVAESAFTQVYQPLFPLFPAAVLSAMKGSGMFTLSEPGELDDVLADAGLVPRADDDIESLTEFENGHDACGPSSAQGRRRWRSGTQAARRWPMRCGPP